MVALAESQIDAAIVSQSDHSGDIEHKPPNALRGLFIERGGAASRHGLRERRGGIPFGVVAENLRTTRLKPVIGDLADREHGEFGGCDGKNRGAEFAAGDKLLDERGLGKLTPHEAHALRKRGGVVHDRTVVDADARVFRRGLDDQRKCQAIGGDQILAAIDNDIGRGLDPARVEDSLGERLIQQQAERQRRGTGVRDLKQLVQGCHVHLQRGLADETLATIEDQLGTVLREKLAKSSPVSGGEDHRVMAGLCETPANKFDFADDIELCGLVKNGVLAVTVSVGPREPVLCRKCLFELITDDSDPHDTS